MGEGGHIPARPQRNILQDGIKSAPSHDAAGRPSRASSLPQHQSAPCSVKPQFAVSVVSMCANAGTPGTARNVAEALSSRRDAELPSIAHTLVIGGALSSSTRDMLVAVHAPKNDISQPARVDPKRIAPLSARAARASKTTARSVELQRCPKQFPSL